jgi:hypothetical protein
MHKLIQGWRGDQPQAEQSRLQAAPAAENADFCPICIALGSSPYGRKQEKACSKCGRRCCRNHTVWPSAIAPGARAIIARLRDDVMCTDCSRK